MLEITTRIWRREHYLVSTSPALLQPDAVHAALNSDVMWWASGLPRSAMHKALRNSLCLGLYVLVGPPSPVASAAGEAGGSGVGVGDGDGEFFRTTLTPSPDPKIVSRSPPEYRGNNGGGAFSTSTPTGTFFESSFVSPVPLRQRLVQTSSSWGVSSSVMGVDEKPNKTKKGKPNKKKSSRKKRDCLLLSLSSSRFSNSSPNTTSFQLCPCPFCAVFYWLFPSPLEYYEDFSGSNSDCCVDGEHSDDDGYESHDCDSSRSSSSSHTMMMHGRTGNSKEAHQLDGPLLPPAYHTEGPTNSAQQIGLVRVVTDDVTFAYLTDVYVLPDYQDKGLGPWMLECLDEIVKGWPHLRRLMFVTSSSMDLYRRTLGAREWDEFENAGKLKIGMVEGPGCKKPD